MSHGISKAVISDAFEEAVWNESGTIMESIDDGVRVFVRALLPGVDEVQPGDHMRAGGCLRATESSISVHPFLFRKICNNGAITARSLASRHLELSDYPVEFDVISAMQEAVHACSDPSVFASGMRSMRTAVLEEVDLALHMMPVLHELQQMPSVNSASEIIRRILAEGVGSRFSLMNAVTAVARDLTDPQQRWDLEELGGAIGACIITPPNAPGGHTDDAGQAAEFESAFASQQDRHSGFAF